MPRRRVLLLVRRHVVTKPAATALIVTEPVTPTLFVAKPATAALRLRPLLKPTEIEKLCGGRSGRAQHQTNRNGQRNQPTTPGKDALLSWIPWHAPGPQIRRTCPERLAQPPRGGP